MSERHTPLSALVPALALLVFSVAWTGAVALWPERDKPVAAIFPPARSAESALAGTVAAGAEAVQGFGGWSTVVIAQSRNPDFISNLYRQGAMLVVKARAVACGR